MVSQHSRGKKEEWEMAGLRRFHGPKQGLPEGSLPHAADRPIGRFDCRTPPNEFFGRFPRLPKTKKKMLLSPQSETIIIR